MCKAHIHTCTCAEGGGVREVSPSEVHQGIGIYGGVVHFADGEIGGESNGLTGMWFIGVLLDAFWHKVCVFP